MTSQICEVAESYKKTKKKNFTHGINSCFFNPKKGVPTLFASRS